MARRKTLIGISILGHAALLAGVLVHSAWDIDRLDPETRRPLALAALGPPMTEEAGSPDLPKPKEMQRKEPPVVVKEPRQPRKLEDLEVKFEATGPGTGEGTGPGTLGPPGGGGPCRPEDGDCAPPPPIVPLPDPPEVPDPPRKEPTLVSPQILKGLRTSGETTIYPPRDAYNQMFRDGNYRTSGILKVCITAGGAVASVAVLKSTGYSSYDEALAAAARRWTYQPYTAGGTPVPVCSSVTFMYQMK